MHVEVCNIVWCTIHDIRQIALEYLVCTLSVHHRRKKNGSVAHLVLQQLVSAAMFEQECEEIVCYLFA